MTDMIPQGLPALEARLSYEMQLLNLPTKAWSPECTGPDGAEVLDVAIVGAGLCGLVAAGALWQLGVQKVRLFDRAPENREGPWITYARMETLRTVKEATGPALGIPSLTFRAWFEAQFGRGAWDDMRLAPREMWMDYMIWYRRMIGADVVNNAQVSEISDEGRYLRLTVSGAPVYARRIILATGLDALGAPRLPAVAQGLPVGVVRHSADMFDTATLKGLRVAVIGAGASAMDNAAAALEAGAARVDVLVRRPEIPRIDKFTGVGSRGMTHGYLGLPDARKWELMDLADDWPVPPPRHSVQRVARHDNAHLHVASPVIGLKEVAGGLEITTPNGTLVVDTAIFATGFGLDLSQRPELAKFAPHVRTWGDRMGPEAAQSNPGLAAHPYLADDFTFTEKTPGACPALPRISCFAYPSVPSHGKLTSGIPAATDGAQRLARGLVSSLFAEDADYHFDRFRAFETPEIHGDEWLPEPISEKV